MCSPASVIFESIVKILESVKTILKGIPVINYFGSS